MTTINTEKKLQIHDLFSREVRPTQGWSEWLERWQAAVTFEEMLGLLHCGFDVTAEDWHSPERDYDETDRIVFYLGIADGWTDAMVLERPEDSRDEYLLGYDKNGNPIRKRPEFVRQILAQKAFDVLCLKFFRPWSVVGDFSTRGGEKWRWERYLTNEELFPVIQNFFREKKVGSRSYITIRNLSGKEEPSTNETHAIAFLLRLARFIWKWEEDEVPTWSKKEEADKVRKQNSAMRRRIDSAKPWMTAVLARIGRLDVLEPRMLTLEDSCLQVLERIVLQCELVEYRHEVSKTRTATTIDEACYAGSPAAWFLKKRELKMRESARLTAILEKERARERIERELRELQSKS